MSDLNLPAAVETMLGRFVESAKAALGGDLKSIVLYGSAAEGRLRPTSDVNLILVLGAFEGAKVDALREPMRAAHAAIQLNAMFVLEAEVAATVEAFAVKFADVLHRHRVLFGADPFVNVKPSRAAELARLRQVLLNLVLRLRERYISRSLRDEQAVAIVAESAGPLRACAAALQELRGQPAADGKAALAALAGPGWEAVLEQVSAARETRALAPGVAAPTVLKLIELASHLRSLTEGLS